MSSKSANNSEHFADGIVESINKVHEQDFNKMREEFLFSGYELGLSAFDNHPDHEGLQEASNYAIFGFPVLIVLSVISFVLAMTSKHKLLRALTVGNLIIVLITLGLFVSSDFIETPGQIKIGYYLIVVNLTALLFVTNRKVKEESST